MNQMMNTIRLVLVVILSSCEIGLTPVWVGPDGKPGKPTLEDTWDTGDTGRESEQWS